VFTKNIFLSIFHCDNFRICLENFGHSAWGETPLRARDSVKERLFAAIELPRPFFAIILADISITMWYFANMLFLFSFSFW
jgi:hypothetical protein